MTRITEGELILPALSLIEKSTNGINTTDLIAELRDLLNPEGEDLMILKGRKDDRFSQKVRNLKSHNTLERKGFALYDRDLYKITKEGIIYLEENKDKLNLIIEEEVIRSKTSAIISNYYEDFLNNISNVRAIFKESLEFLGEDKIYFYNLLYSSVITSLEAYLYDAIKFEVFNDSSKKYLRNFVENFKDYREEKFIFINIFNEFEGIEIKVEEALGGLLYHNLPKIGAIYKETFDVDFGDIRELMKAINIRHDIVHRNGKNKEGVPIKKGPEDIEELLKNAENFIENINNQLKCLINI